MNARNTAASGWIEIHLGQLVDNFDALRIPIRESDRRRGDYPYYGASGIVDYVDDFLFDGDYLLIAEDGENLRTRSLPIAFMARGRFWVNNHAHIVRGAPGIDTRFLMYALSSLDIGGFLTGSTMPKLTQASMSRIPILVPPLSEQVAIVRILGSLDEKIELNRSMNQTLEAMARAIFKSWFVDFEPVREGHPRFTHSFRESLLGLIPNDWGVGVLRDFVEDTIGGDWGTATLSDTETEAALCVRGADIPQLQEAGTGKMPVRFLSARSLAKRTLREGDLVIEISGGSPSQSTGRCILMRKRLLDRFSYPLVCSNFCRIVRPRLTELSSFLHFWLDWLYSKGELLKYENGTTGIKNLAFRTFSESHQLVVPLEPVLQAFNDLTFPLLDRQQCNGAESSTLAALRDALLPKLLSGEIRVKQAEEVVGEFV